MSIRRDAVGQVILPSSGGLSVRQGRGIFDPTMRASVTGVAAATASERMSRVLELLETHDVVTVAGLAHAFAVSAVTVRSDLAVLAREGRLVRIRGGARSLHQEHSEPAFDMRLRAQKSEKCAIARAAAAIVEDGEAIALDSSTTAYYLALELRRKRELVVVTNGLRVAMALAGAPGVSVIVPGGELQLAATSIVGKFVSSMLETIRISKGFFGARGISVERGLMDFNPDEVKIKREIADVCEQVVGIADNTKWHRTALLSFMSSQRIDTIITDEGSPAEAVAEWRERDVEVISAPLDEALQAPIARP